MGLFAPLGVSALGVGDIRMHSALNQTLNAEIPLVISGSETLSDIRVKLAPPEAFSRAGLERHYFLTGLRFEPMQSPDGKLIIKVRSREVVREPFLSFLVEVNWPQGRMLKEYTVLLDPPKTLPETTTIAQAVPTIGRQTGESSDDPDSRPGESPDLPDAQGMGKRRLPYGMAGPGIHRYGPVKKNDTLSGIARQMNSDPAISQTQFAVALFRHNANAFIQNDINALKSGAYLDIPDRERILRISQREARQELFRAYDARVGQKSPSRDARTSSSSHEDDARFSRTTSQLQLLTPSEPEAKDQQEVSGKNASSKPKSEIALEVADTVKQENEEIRSRLASLEQQLAMMQRLITLKDEQIAILQAQQGNQAQTRTIPAPPAESVREQAQQTPAPLPEAASHSVQQAPPIGTEAKPAHQPKPGAEPTDPEASSFGTGLFSEPYYLAFAGVGLSLVAFVAWIIVLKRSVMLNKTENVTEEVEFKPNERDALAADDSTIEPSQNIAKSSFLSEFTTTDFDLDTVTDEVDPISEADVYLAYGRYKQAEDLMRNAIGQHPERDECKLKLLEIYYAAENKSAFADYAKELQEQNKDANREFWLKVQEMGQELCPENPLFSDDSNSTILANHAGIELERTNNAEGLLETGNTPFIEDLPENFRKIELEHDQAYIDLLLDFENTGREQVKTSLDVKRESDQHSESESLESELPTRYEAQADAISSYGLENLIPFETAKGRFVPSRQRPQASRKLLQSDQSIDDILRELTDGPAAERSKDNSLSTENGDGQYDEFDFELNLLPLEKPEPSNHSSTDLDEVEVVTAGLNDIETKLDLAKAYIDMRDDVSARDILAEVLAKGSDGQKKEAQLLVERLNQQRSA
jgi:pilus assembly protein FimV